MKKLLIIFVAIVYIVTTGCLKDVASTDLNATGNPFVEFEYPAGGGGSAIGSGLEYFGGGALTYPSSDVSDTAVIYANIASTHTLSSALTVTIGPDFKADLDYYSTDSINYVNMPDSDYSIINATQTIPAGQRQATFKIVFYPSKIDITQSYALPITATSSGNIPVSGNFGHVYFHTIGNPLAGLYTETGTRYNYTGTVSGASLPTTIPAGYVSTTDLGPNSPKLASPINAHTVSLPFANLGGNGAAYVYLVTGNTTYSAVSVDYGFDALYSNIVSYVTQYTPPSATTKPSFHIITHYNNALQGAGNDRVVDETFVHQ